MNTPLERYLAHCGDIYNDELKLLSARIGKHVNRFHVGLPQGMTVHMTRGSFGYALGLLQRSGKGDIERAEQILGQLFSLQDTDPSSPTCGIWSWYYEEPLSKMVRPDFNWANFNAKLMLMAEKYHGTKLGADTRTRLRDSVMLCCGSIMKRDVSITYTNIAIMDCLVTIMAGEVFQKPELVTWGLGKFKRFCALTDEAGCFPEYNSPTYTVVALDELSAIVSCCETPEAVEMAGRMLKTAWRMTALHYHVPTRQWGDPHGRCYDTLPGWHQKDGTWCEITDFPLSFLQVALKDQVEIVPPDRVEYRPAWAHEDIRCPEEFLHCFQAPSTGTVVDVIERSDGFEKKAVFYNSPAVAAGGFDKNILWDHNRALIWYFDNNGRPAYANFQFVYNDHGFCSAVVTTSMHEEEVLAGVNFATDYGVRFLAADPTHGRIRASRLKIRLELGGFWDAGSVTIEPENRKAFLKISGREYVYTVHHAVFGEEEPRFEMGVENGKTHIDLTIYEGAEKEFVFAVFAEAAFLFSFLRIGGQDPAVEFRTGRLGLSRFPMKIGISATPAPLSTLFRENTTSETKVL